MRVTRQKKELLFFSFLLLVFIGAAFAGGVWNAEPEANDTTGSNDVTGDGDTPLRFNEVSNSIGLNYSTSTPSSIIVNGGVFVGDYDRDGWPDLLVTGGKGPVLFENENGTFERSEALPPLNGTAFESALFFDYNNDGQEDLLLLARDREPLLLRNEGGVYTRQPKSFNQPLTYPVGATTADYDSDGCLDLFVYQYADWMSKEPAGANELHIPKNADNGNPNYLYRGDCRGGFERVNSPAISGSRWSLAASFVDLTGDSSPDIHVGNDFNNDVLYANQGNGTFTQIILDNATNRNAMSSEIGDIDGDGRPDIFVTNIQLPDQFKSIAGLYADRMHGNNLLLNRQNGTFEPAAEAVGVQNGGWGWAAVLADFDNDGDADLFHTTKRMEIPVGIEEDIREEGTSIEAYLRKHPTLRYPQYYNRTETGFKSVHARYLGFDESSGTGVARLDFDRDGDLDLAIAQVSGPLLLYENNVKRGNWLQIELQQPCGEPATGSKVSVTAGDTTHYRFGNSRADFLSQDSRVIHVGLGSHDKVRQARIRWPDGKVTTVRNVTVNQRLTVAPDGIPNQTSVADAAKCPSKSP